MMNVSFEREPRSPAARTALARGASRALWSRERASRRSTCDVRDANESNAHNPASCLYSYGVALYAIIAALYSSSWDAEARKRRGEARDGGDVKNVKRRRAARHEGECVTMSARRCAPEDVVMRTATGNSW